MYVNINTLCLGYYLGMTLGDNIKTLRKQNGISQKQFADKMNTTQQRVSEWECNKVEPTLFNVARMLVVLNASFDELVEGVYDGKYK